MSKEHEALWMALAEARQRIEDDRDCFIESTAVRGDLGSLDEADAAYLAGYDDLLAKIDAALSPPELLTDDEFAGCVQEAGGFQTLGPGYFAARRVADRMLAGFESDPFRKVIDGLTKKLADEVWQSIDYTLSSDMESSVQNQIWHTVDQIVRAILTGERWAVEKYALAERYDCEKVRETLARHVPVELQNKRIADLEARVAELDEQLRWARR